MNDINLADKLPIIRLWWSHYNKDKTPDQYSILSSRRIFLKCPQLGHDFESTPKKVIKDFKKSFMLARVFHDVDNIARAMNKICPFCGFKALPEEPK